MSAPKGNTYAEKWSKDEAISFVGKVEEHIRYNPDCVFIGEAVTEVGEYRELWSYIQKKFEDEPKVFHTIRVVNSILEQRLYKRGLTKEFSGRLVEFGLENNHGWEDRKSLAHSGFISEDPPSNLQELYDEERHTESES